MVSPAHAQDSARATGVKPALTVNLLSPTMARLPIRLSANGAIAAWQEATLGAEVSGLRVLELYANVGDYVRRGQVLATFAAETIQADVAVASAALAEAQAQSEEAAGNAERARNLQLTGTLSLQQIQQYLTLEQSAKARVASAQARLDAQLLRLKQTQLLAPDDGIIASRSTTVGAVVSPGGEMFRLIRQGRLEWRGEITAVELERVRVGQAVLLSSASGAQQRGQVRMLAPTVDPLTRKALVYVDLLAPAKTAQRNAAALAFRPGVYVRGEIDLGTSDALTVPRAAVVDRDGFSYVYRVGPDQRVAQVKVQTGRLVGERLELLSGVQPTDRLVASGGSFLSDGDLVRVLESPAK